MKKISKIIFGTVIIFILLIVITLILALLFFPSEKIKALVQDKASAALDMPVSIGGIGLSFAGIPSIKLTDIKIGPPEGKTKPLAAVKSVKVMVNILKLFKKEVEIVSVDLSSPSIQLVIPKTDSEMAKHSEDTAKRASLPKLPFPVTLRMLGIKNGCIEVENQKNDTRLLFEKITQKLSLDISKDLTMLNSTGSLTVDDISFSPGDTDNPVKGLHIELEHKITGDLRTGNLNIARCDLSVNELPFVVNGEVNNWTKSNFQINSGNLNAEKFLSAIPSSLLSDKEKINADGDFSLSINFTADTEPEIPVIAYNGNIDIEKMNLSYQGFPKSVDNIKTHITFSEKDINIEDLSLNSGNSNLSLSGTVNSYMESPVISMKVNGKIDTEDITNSLPIFEKQKIKGLIDVNLNVSGSPAEPESMIAYGDLSFREFGFELPETLQNPAKLNGFITISPAALVIEDITMTSGKSDCIFKGELKDYMNLVFPDESFPVYFKGTVISDVIDFNSLLVTKEKKDPQTFKLWDMEQTLKTMPIPPNLSVETTVKLGNVIFGRLESDSTQGKIALKNGILELTDLDISAYRGSLKGKTSVNFSDIENVSYNGVFSLEKLDSGEFISDFFGTDNFFRGKLSISLNFSGAGLDSLSMLKNLKGSGNMKFENGQIDNWDFTKKLGKQIKFLDFDTLDFDTIDNSFIIKDQKFITPDMSLKTVHGDIFMNGYTGFDRSIDYEITLILDKSASQKAAKELSALSTLINKDTESLELIVKAGGTLTSPKFKLDTSRAEKQLREEVKDEIKSRAYEIIEKNIKDEKLKEEGKKLLEKLFK